MHRVFKRFNVELASSNTENVKNQGEQKCASQIRPRQIKNNHTKDYEKSNGYLQTQAALRDEDNIKSYGLK